MNKPLASAKNFVRRNKTVLITSAVGSVAIYVWATQTGLKQHDNFLKEHGLYEEFYTPENSY
jgi:hypothetical protein